jgi:hypothetical protein
MVAAARKFVIEARKPDTWHTTVPTMSGQLVVEMTTPVLDPDAIGHLHWFGDIPGGPREVWEVHPLRGVSRAHVMKQGTGFQQWQNATFAKVPVSLRVVREQAKLLRQMHAWPASRVRSQSMQRVVLDERGRTLGFMGTYV